MMNDVTKYIALDIRIEAGNWGDLTQLEGLVQKAINAVLSCPAFMAGIKILKGSELSLLFTDDSHIQAFNTQFRAKNQPTNVLSFPQHEADETQFGPCLGDIVIAFETILRESKLENKIFNHHLQHLIVHGFLHLFGYDHEVDEDAEEMENLETTILLELGIDDPYKD